jgi:hypothetical protein
MADYRESQETETISELYRRVANLEAQLVSARSIGNIYSPRINPIAYPTPVEGQHAIDPADDQHMWFARGEWRKATGFGIYDIKVYEDTVPASAGDGSFKTEIPEDFDGAELVKVEGYVSTASSSGSLQVQVQNRTASVDMLSSKITIDSGELNSKDSGTQPVVIQANAGVSWGDHIWLDIDAAGSNALGLGIILYFLPSGSAQITIQGAKGDPGGVTTWTGVWIVTTTYTSGQAVSNNGSSYVAIIGSTGIEPGVTPGWQTYWMLLTEVQKFGGLDIGINGNNYIIDTGIKGWVEIPYDCTIVSATLLTDSAGNLVVDIWKDTYGAFPPTVGDSITGGNPLTITGGIKTQDTALTGWTVALIAGDVLAFNVNSCSAAKKISIALKLARL